jgi:two-component system, response regulator PdtaR
MLTAFSQRELIEQARDAGAMAYLVKPFARHELVPAIELAVSRFAEKRALEDEVATLNDRLETRKLVDRAKGLLMTRQTMTEPEAFRWIQRTAMDRRTTMKAGPGLGSTASPRPRPDPGAAARPARDAHGRVAVR